MATAKRKIINDPVYGFITITHPLIFQIIEHPCYQRLRRIQQMAMANLVYPGAVHTRLHHSLGAYHLMSMAITELCNKGADITEEETLAAKAAILLHDIGHGPYSHALEHKLAANVHHETMSRLLMQQMNNDLNGGLDLAIRIFNNTYHKPFLHQLISGQIDVDRMDYLSRDSFFTGVSEGVIGYDRILKMMVVQDNQLMIEEKGIYSVEKFLVARRQMYWQVYLHKTVLSAEQTLKKIIERVKEIYPQQPELQVTGALHFFLHQFNGQLDEQALQLFCNLDDTDILFAIKQWCSCKDVVLRTLCSSIIDRRLLKCRIQAHPFDEQELSGKRKELAAALHISEAEAAYLVFTGETANTTYSPRNEQINILFKNGSVKQISQVDNPLIHQALSETEKKYYACYKQL
jgi:HD superfamily phosphohydrolase